MATNVQSNSVQTISVLVPLNPFVPASLSQVKHCLAALNVEKLMEWWPGMPHQPHRRPDKVRAIQRSLDWKRVAQIAAYLLQEEILDAPDKLNECFRNIYEPKRLEPGRSWPPKVPRVIKYERSEYPTFSNVLLHVNGASISPMKTDGATGRTANLVFNEKSSSLNFSVIDGQHRINGAYFAVHLLRKKTTDARWEIPAEIFLDLDASGEPPKRQAQIFIDVNFYQKKVDRSLVADLFPTARGRRTPLDNKERAQDLGRKLMLEVGPLVGMIQIPGIRFGVKDVVTLATLNAAIEDVLDCLETSDVNSLDDQAQFLATCLDAWLIASGRKEELIDQGKLDADNVAYQGRVLVSFLSLVPACIWALRRNGIQPLSDAATPLLVKFLKGAISRAGLLEDGVFLPKSAFREKGFLGSGGIGRFRNTLWAAVAGRGSIEDLDDGELAARADKNRSTVRHDLATNQ